jgi:hypothetical protein
VYVKERKTMYEVIVSIPMKITIDGNFEDVVKEAMDTAYSAQKALANALKDPEHAHIQVFSPWVISAVDKNWVGKV